MDGCGSYGVTMREVVGLRMPLVSVVMGVRNAETSLSKTLFSILEQEDIDIEFIVINDGSTDKTGEILSYFQCMDPRIRVITTKKEGLTKALIRGCDEARGEFIARQDANDRSLQGRLSEQAKALSADRSASFCSTQVRFMTREGIEVFTTAFQKDGVPFGGVIHGSVMMKTDYYKKAGGYRRQFYYAQDVDLWERMKDFGGHVLINRVCYEALLFPESISATKKKEQGELTELIKKTTDARRAGLSEDMWLERAEDVSSRSRDIKLNKGAVANGNYFIGGCLLKEHPEVAREYLRAALRANPLHLKARLRLLENG
jgi:glycosyltransferase involved in cell wall biosynthesis